MKLKLHEVVVIAVVFVGFFLLSGLAWEVGNTPPLPQEHKTECVSPASRYPKGAMYLEIDICPLLENWSGFFYSINNTFPLPIMLLLLWHAHMFGLLCLIGLWGNHERT